MRHRPTDCRLQAAGEGVKQLDNKLAVWRTSSMEIQQAKDSRYVKNAGAVFNLSYHIVFCPKYRRKVLVGDVETRLKRILYATAQQYGVLIETMEGDARPRSFVRYQTRLDEWQRLSTVLRASLVGYFGKSS